MDVDEVKALMVTLDEKKYRGEQVFQWMNRGIKSFSEMNNLPKTIQEKLDAIAFIDQITLEQSVTSSDEQVTKFGFKLGDGQVIESVLMSYHHGNTLCISSQAGCRMGCSFCASTLSGLNRNLTASEMLGQVLGSEAETNKKVSNIVIMGCGEPFDNYEQVVKFAKMVNSKFGLNLGMRSITISTCGLVPKIIDLAHDLPQVNLAISLHSVKNSIRSAMMPVNQKYPVETLLDACRQYQLVTKRRIMFEYTPIKGLNDSLEDANQLAKALRGIVCHVNLIPLNTVDETSYKGTKMEQIRKFKGVLEENNVTVTIRRELGIDVNAACGQLRATLK